MSPKASRLEVRSLSKTFGTVQVLTDVELTVVAGEVHGVAGQNGSGKSTLIKILTGLYTPDPGADYRVNGVSMRLPVRWPEVHAAGVLRRLGVEIEPTALVGSLSAPERAEVAIARDARPRARHRPHHPR